MNGGSRRAATVQLPAGAATTRTAWQLHLKRRRQALQIRGQAFPMPQGSTATRLSSPVPRMGRPRLTSIWGWM